MNDKPTEIPIYIATAFADGLTLAARCAADLAAHGLTVPTDAQWWRWPECALPVESPYMQKLRARTLVVRAEHEVEKCGRILVLLTNEVGVGTGYEIAVAKAAKLPIYWINCGRTREIPPLLVGYGTEVVNLADLAKVTGARPVDHATLRPS